MLTELQKSLASLYLFVLIYPFHLMFVLVALWAIWKHPDLRRKAALVIVLPVVFLFLPYLITSLFGGPLHAGQFAGIAVGTAIIGVVLGLAMPQKAVTVLPNGLFRSRGFNIVIIALIALAWLFPVVAIIWLSQEGATNPTGGGQGSPGMGVAVMFVLVGMYFVGVGAASVVTALFGWLGLRGGVDGAQRGLHTAQLVLSAPGVLLGSGTLLWLLTQAG